MKSQRLLDALGKIDDKHINEAGEKNGKENRRIRLITRLAAAAVFVAVMVTAVTFYLGTHPWDGIVNSGEASDITGGDSSGTTSTDGIPYYTGSIYTASEIWDLFDGDGINDWVATSAYTLKYYPSADFIPLGALPQENTAVIYEFSRNEKAFDYDELYNLADKVLGEIAKRTGNDKPDIYTTREYHNLESISVLFDVDWFGAFQYKTHNMLYFTASSSENPTRPITLGDISVQVDQRQSDEEIIESLQDVKKELFEIFGCSFENARVIRKYDSYSTSGVTWLYVYYYNESDHPLNKKGSTIFSDNICIYFDNFKNYAGDIVSDTVLTKASIQYISYRVPPTDLLKATKRLDLISLSDAEDLLAKGYVFGGHVCPLCMAAQEKIDFEDYDYVGLENRYSYDKDMNVTISIPFYAFYKQIGVAANGNFIFAKTYVAAIKLTGYKEYFENQRKDHNKLDR